ncbi:MAG: CRISPR-associated endonuclease Cas1 [Clostridia bacterium]
MKKLLNTLYVTSEDAYLTLNGENIVIIRKDKENVRFPLCNLEEIVCFNYTGASPQLMGKCMADNISLTFLSPSGKLLGRVIGRVKGNVFTRIAQIKMFENYEVKLKLIQNTIACKLLNTKFLISRSLRDYPEIDNDNRVSELINKITKRIDTLYGVAEIDVLRGIEGDIAKDYFGIYDRLIRNNAFKFNGRSKQPPLDEINACLSFLYSIESNSIAAALELAGIDSYIGFFHTERPGRISLALDIVEEFRAMIDRFVISVINLKQLTLSDFIKEIGGSVLLNDSGRQKILKLWQDKKKENIYHPVLKQNMQFGILPFIQANLFGKFLRGEMEEYIPYLIK